MTCLSNLDILEYTPSRSIIDKAKDETEVYNAISLRSAGVGGMGGSLTLCY